MGKQADDIIAAEGKWGRIVCVVRRNGSAPAEDFIKELDRFERAEVRSLFQKMADEGKIFNKQQFRHLAGKIYEFKRHQVRFGCFQMGHTWVLTHGFIKKQPKCPRTEIERAERIMKEHLSRKR